MKRLEEYVKGNEGWMIERLLEDESKAWVLAGQRLNEVYRLERLVEQIKQQLKEIRQELQKEQDRRREKGAEGA